MKKMRYVIQADRSGLKLEITREILSEQPSGNAHARNKALRSGWHPQWFAAGRPAICPREELAAMLFHVATITEEPTPEPPEIAAALYLAVQLTGVQLPGHTCIDQPSQPCAVPECL